MFVVKKINLKEKNMAKEREFLSSVSIEDVFSEKVLMSLTESIMLDEEQNLMSREDWEIEEFFKDAQGFSEWSDYRRELYIDYKVKELGYGSVKMTASEWFEYFIDYIDHDESADEEYNQLMDIIDKLI